ncbi:MAG: phytanoyl-CoA dioxygenase family protein [Candidatus Omnitrophica bacterium]|nr:phytanoyl-CoA dioxygenase family protein [Candidatus Omnitrophota bacterium]
MNNKEFPLTREQVRFYRQNGYIQLHNVLSPQEVSELRKILTRAVKDRKKKFDPTQIQFTDEYQKVFTQVVNLWQDYEEIQPYIHSPKLAEIARRLVGCRSIRLWHDHALIKPGRDGVETKWHQDFPYWPMNEPGALSCWIALDDVNEKNGCLSFIPGSHQKGRLKPVSLTNRQNIFRQAGMKKRDIQPVAMEMKAGSCTFHDGNTFHYAGGNTTSRPRRALAIIYFPSGTTYNGAPHVVTDDLGFEVGAKLQGPRFPVLARK